MKSNGTRFSWPSRALVGLAGLTLFAQVGAAPIVAQSFGLVSILGLAANLIVVPTLFYLIPAGFMVAFLGLVSAPVAQFVAHWLVSPMIHFVVATVTLFAKIPGATVLVPPPNVAGVALFYVAIVGVYVLFEPRILKTPQAAAARGEAG